MPNSREIIGHLVETFRRNLDTYKASYNETMVRREFIDPLFAALCWDVTNIAGYAEAYKEVVHEDAIKVGGATKAPDYAFRIGGVRKFFVEAKKPSVDIKEDIHPAYQLRRYAWSAKLPLSILTDFEEFAVYDCRIKPVKTDKASTARVLYMTFEEYENRWEEIESIFSKEAILKGSFDRYVESTRRKRGTAEVDKAFLKEIETWRDELARNIALRNPGLTQQELNFAVSRTIDRIIFLRICEDRGIEDYGQLMSLRNGENVYKRLVNRFIRADEKYNSGLFHFRNERSRGEQPDELTLTLAIDDKILKDIFKRLYYPESPYEFAVLPADILGHIYEQFLGKVIRLTPGHRAKIEEKPEVRKAGGVYYTPTYIVDYIVKNTVGKLLEGKTPRQVSRLKILDPACGSGSFLIGAYQYLLDWHLDWYNKNDPEKWARRKAATVYQVKSGEWRLTTAKRKEILLNNIYGVDIDSQAVEVTKLSLLLKVLEGENRESINRQMKFFHERALPDLGYNIKCGNSLIGPDFYDNQQVSLLDEEEQYRINVFDWEAEFPEVFQVQAAKDTKEREGKSGHFHSSTAGFDAVIGNPPYVRSQHLDEQFKEYVVNQFEAAAYQPDTFALFLEQSIKLLGSKGRLSFILPNGILTNKYYGKLRRFILRMTAIDTIVDLKDGVFEKASVDTSIFVLRKASCTEQLGRNSVAIGEFPARINTRVETPIKTVKQKIFFELPDQAFNVRMDENTFRLISRIRKNSKPLDDIVIVKAGMKVRKIYVNKRKKTEAHEMFLLGSDIKPYWAEWRGKWVHYDKSLEMQYTNQAFRDEQIFRANEKILVRQVMGKDRIYATLDTKRFFCDQTIYILLPKNNSPDCKYLLALLCSKTMNYYFSSSMSDRKRTFPKIKGSQIKQLPIHDIGSYDSSDKFLHDKIIQLVDRMLALNKQLAKAKAPHDREVLQRQIDATDKQIDRLVYELYGLTEEEIGIVEGRTNV